MKIHNRKSMMDIRRNRAVFEHPNGVLEAIRKHLTIPTTTPDPS